MMVCRMLVRSKVFVRVGVLASILMAVGLAYVMVPSPYEGQLKALRQTCAALTQNDPDGRVYEAIVGRYVENQSFVQVTSHPTEYSYQLTLTNAGVEKKLHIERVSKKKFEQEYKHVLSSSLQNENGNRGYGVCAYKSEWDQDIFEIKTLVEFEKWYQLRT